MRKNSLLVIALTFFFAMSVGLMYTTYQINVRKDEIFDLRKKQEEEKVAQNLKSYVDIAYSAIDSQYKKSSMDKKYLEQHSGHRLKNVIETAEMILKRKSNQVSSGQLTLAEAQAQALEEIELIRYDNGVGYIMINDTTLPYPKMIMHPIQPSLNGQIMDAPKYNNTWKEKQNLYVAFVEVTQRHGEGFVIYLAPNKKGEIYEVPKLAYVKLFPEWNWIISTEIYIGKIIIQSMNEIKEAIRSMRYNDGSGYFWIIAFPYEFVKIPITSFPKYIMHPMDVSRENKPLDGELSKFSSRVEAFINVCQKEENNSGYVEYHGEKITDQGTLNGVPKLTYVRLYEPLGWIIGTGSYLDSIEQSIIQEKKYLNEKVIQVIIRLLATALFMILFVSTLGYAIISKKNMFKFKWRLSKFW